MLIRTIAEFEHALVRDLRLAAVRDAPSCFAESEPEVSAKPESYWQDLTRALTSTHVMFVAETDGVPRGSVYGLPDNNNPGGGRVGGMWVDSSYRRRGLGRELLQGVENWAREQGFSTIRLWVPTHSAEACGLYSGFGFAFTGETKSAEGDSPFVVLEMILNLSADADSTTVPSTRP